MTNMKNSRSTLTHGLCYLKDTALMICLMLPIPALASTLGNADGNINDSNAAINVINTNANISSDIHNDTTPNKTNDTPIDFSAIEAMPHELAFTQVLSEICPYLLDDDKQAGFANAYEAYLQLFMPNLDTRLVMQHYNDQKDYRTILEGERRRTLSYPIDENRALCVDIVDTPFSS